MVWLALHCINIKAGKQHKALYYSKIAFHNLFSSFRLRLVL